MPAFLRSVRFRLAITYSILVFALAVAVVGVVNYALSQSLEAQTVSAGRQFTTIIDPVSGTRVTVEREIQLQYVTLEQLVTHRAIDNLQRISFWVILAMFPASVGIGWWVADKALRPIGHIAAVARDIQQTEDLSRRIDLDGPDDELKDLADTFDGMLEQIEASAAARRSFVQDISHELRNPLAVMATNLDVVLADDSADVDRYRETSMIVRRTVDRTARTVDDLVVFARNEVPDSRRERVELVDIVDEALAEHSGPIEAAGLHVTRIGSGVVVSVDRIGVKRAVSNLVSNSVRLTRPGTEVTAGVGERSGFAWVAVIDDGPGIDPREHDHVFRRGWSKDQSSLGGEDRSGIGLAIARQVAEAHGGCVTLRSTLGAGAEFVLWIPMSAEADRSRITPDGTHHDTSVFDGSV